MQQYPHDILMEVIMYVLYNVAAVSTYVECKWLKSIITIFYAYHTMTT